MVLYIQNTFHKIPSIGCIVMDEGGKIIEIQAIKMLSNQMAITPLIKLQVQKHTIDIH